MQATAQILSKLRNARFQPPNGAAKEKLAWINNGEADLLRSIGGSGKKRKFGLRSFSFRDNSSSANRNSTNDGNGGSMRAGGDVKGTGSGSGKGGTGGLMGNRSTALKQATHVPVPMQKPVMPVYTLPPPVFTPPPVALTPLPTLLAPPVPRMKPAVPVQQPTIQPQNYGFVAPAMTPRAPAPAPTIAPQNYGFAAPMRAAAPARTAAPMTRAAEIRTDRMVPQAQVKTTYSEPARTDRTSSGGFQPSSFKEAAVRSDRAPSMPGAGVRAVPEGPRADRMATPQNFTSMAAEAAARAAANRSRVPAGSIPTPRQNPLRDLTKIRTDSTFNANTDFGRIDGATLSRLAALQTAYGKPITVTEGAAPTGTHVSKSQHHVNPLTGKANALDLSVPTRDRATLASLANDVGFGGIGAYGTNLPNMIHVDTGKKRSWGPQGKARNIGQLTDRALQAALRDRATRRSITSYAGLDDY